MGLRKLAHVSPGRVILFAIFCTIMLGALGLALPISRTVDMSFIDLLFTATSTACVTGLYTIPLSNFTMFGKSILLILMQIGGLGLITMTLFTMSLFTNIGLATQLIAGKLLELESWHNIKKFIIFIITMTLGIELIGALCIFPILHNIFPWHKALFFSLFHSVSSFCNAGISIFDGDLQLFSHNYPMLFITAFLVFCGGLGFITWHEIVRYAQARMHGKRFVFSLHSKIIMYASAILIVGFGIVFWILEHANSLYNMTGPQALANSLFHGITLRSAGILTVPIAELQVATIFCIMILAFIGSAPGSTGSGIKVTTLAVFLATIKAAVTGRTSVEIRGRTIAKEQVYKATAIVSLSIAWIAFITLCLLITEPYADFMDLFVETISGFTNLGLSTGITPLLSSLGKLFIMVSMVIGRIGSLTLILALKLQTKPETSGFSYPEERIMLS